VKKEVLIKGMEGVEQQRQFKNRVKRISRLKNEKLKRNNKDRVKYFL
jgi:hypothetical protein